MSIFNIFKQLVKPNKINFCNKCYQINSKSFTSTLHHWNIKSFVKNFSPKIKLDSQFILGKNTISRLITTKAETNVVKDVVLYSYVNARRTSIMLLFGLSQSFFWYYMGYIIVTELRDVPVDGDTDKPKDFFTKHNFGENKWKYSMGFVCAVLGTLAAGLSLVYNTRLITSIKLDKAGKTLTLWVAEDRMWRKKLTVPISHVSAMYSRNEMKAFFPFKVKDKSLIYLLDLDGDINNTVLFDVTVGTKRSFGTAK